MTAGGPVRKKSNAPAVWITLGSLVGALVVFFIGLGVGAASTGTSDATATTRQATITATESTTATVTIRARKHHHRSAKPTTDPPRSTPTATHHHAKRPTPTKTRTRTSAPVQHGVHPGAFCSPHGAIGYTAKGTRMRCSKKAGDTGPNGPYWRWRSA